MDLQSLPLWQQLLALMLTHVAPGGSHLSVEVMPECGESKESPTCDVTSPVCEGSDPDRDGVLCGPPFWSDWYGAWVRFEQRSTAAERYIVLAKSLASSAERLLCVGRGETTCSGEDCEPECTPIRWGWDRHAKRNRGSPRSLAYIGLAAAIQESGLREDVRMGRGQARKGKGVDYNPHADSMTGQGRGPGNEIGEMQVMPKMACRFAPWLDENEKKRCLDVPSYRHEVAESMLGMERTAIDRSFTVGLMMLAHSREYCRAIGQLGDDEYPDTIFGHWSWSTFAYYGTGKSCMDQNRPKPTDRVPHPESRTLVRASMFQRFWNHGRVASWVVRYMERRGLLNEDGEP